MPISSWGVLVRDSVGFAFLVLPDWEIHRYSLAVALVVIMAEYRQPSNRSFRGTGVAVFHGAQVVAPVRTAVASPRPLAGANRHAARTDAAAVDSCLSIMNGCRDDWLG